MKKTFLLTAASALIGLAATAQTPAVFTPGQLAVIRFGDGATNRCLPLGAITGITNYSASDLWGSRQSQVFICQFDPNKSNQTNPSVLLACPTNGADGIMVNGNAGTEGNLTLSDDRSLLTFAGYAGDILSIVTGGQTAPSNLSYDRGVATIDAFTNYTTIYRGAKWYGTATGKTNPRGVATDGAGHFWGCGNGYGSLYYDATSGGNDPIQFQNIALTSCSKVINHVLYNTVKGSESVNLYPAGIYTLVDFFNNPAPLPTSASFLHLYLQTDSRYTNCIGFDLNPAETVAYVCDASTTGVGGIQKYIRSGLAWKLAYNLGIPGYYGISNGIMTNAASTNTLVGCFSVTVDWSGANPVLYATTSDSGINASQSYYGNRVIRINDTNAIQDGSTIIVTTNMNILTTVAKPGYDSNGGFQTNIVFKSVTFTPDLRPQIVSNPANWSAAAGDNVSFAISATVSASVTGSIGYQWQQNGTNLVGETAATLNLTSVQTSMNNYAYRCVASDFYGSVTSSVASLTVNASPVAPAITSQNITNYVGNNVTLTALITGTDPKGGYQWYYNGTLLNDGATANGSTLSGTTSNALTIQQAALADAGNYSISVTNIAGSASNTAAKLTLLYAPPIFISPPQTFTTFFGKSITNTVSAYGQLLTYKWYTSTKTTLSGTTLKPLTDTGDFNGTSTAALTVAVTGAADATNYVIVVSNPGGSITSTPAALFASTSPAHTFVTYSNQVYKQDFNSLPIPAGSSVEGNNPLTVLNAVTNIAVINAANPTNAAVLPNGNQNTAFIGTLTYSVDNSFDFGYPVFASGGIGGFGLSKMNGWYGWCQRTMVLSATRGDQSQGAIVDNGLNYLGDGSSIAGVTNRALGLVATTKTGVNCFSVGLINSSTNTNTVITLSCTGELWRNNPNQQPLLFGYAIDPAGSSASFAPGSADFTYGIDNINGKTLYMVTNLNVVFPTSTNTTINDGTLPANQVSISVTNLAITNWPPNTTLWLVWQAATLGTAQDVAIDNLSFSAAAGVVGTVSTPLNIAPGSVHLTGGGSSAATFTFTNTPGLTFSILATNKVSAPKATWPVIGTAVESPANSGNYQFTDPSPATNTTRFYLLRQP
jgi:hypothetical protein